VKLIPAGVSFDLTFEPGQGYGRRFESTGKLGAYGPLKIKIIILDTLGRSAKCHNAYWKKKVMP